MKQNLLYLKKTTLLVLVVLCSSALAMADTFTAVNNGNFSDGATWDNGIAPGNNITGNDLISINSGVTVTLDQDLILNNNGSSLVVMGTLSGTHHIDLVDGSISGSGIIDIHDFYVRNSGTFNFSGDATVDNLFNYGNTTLFADVTVNNAIHLMDGNLSLLGDMSLEDKGTLIFDGGDYLALTGQLNFNGSYNLTYLGSSSNIGSEASGNGLQNLTIDLNNDDDDIELQNDLIVNGILHIQQGIFHTGSNDIIIHGNIISGQQGSIAGNAQSNLTINGNSKSTLYFYNTDNRLNDLRINKQADDQNVTLLSDLRLSGDLNMEKGNLSLNGNALLISGILTSGGTGYLVSGAGSDLTFTHNGDIGHLKFSNDSNKLDNLTLNGGVNTMLTLASDVMVIQSLMLTNGKIDLEAYDLELEENATISGNSQNNYIVTSGEGGLSLSVDNKSEGVFFPIGNSDDYSPVRIYNNKDKADYKVRAHNGVYADGNSGSDLSGSGKMVKGSWFVENNSGANVDINLRVMWSQGMEVNDFKRNNAYISHYTNSSWDVYEQTDAVNEGNGMFSMKRNNITSLSPFSVREVNTSSISGLNAGSVNVYPNPAQNTIQIDIENNPDSDIAIIDISGKEVLNASSNQTIDISGLAQGMYIIRMNGTPVSKFIKQ